MEIAQQWQIDTGHHASPLLCLFLRGVLLFQCHQNNSSNATSLEFVNMLLQLASVGGVPGSHNFQDL